MPPTARTGGPLPILCFLHGYGEAAPLELEIAMRLHGPLNPQSAAAARRDFIVVAPQLPLGGDIWHRYADELREVLEDVHAQHPVDATRTYLTGFSFGGNGVFDLALARPDSWTALWAVDPTRVPRKAPRQPVWLSSGDLARAQKRAFLRTLALAKHGDRVWSDEGEDHVGSARRAYGDEHVYRWLRQFVR